MFCTTSDVEEDKLGVCVQVLIFKNAPLRAGKAVLQLGESISRPGFDDLCGWFSLPSGGGVGWEEEQKKVVRLSKVGEGGYPVCMFYI